MAIDVSRFLKNSAVDTCSIWNITSSLVFTSAVRDVGCSLAATAYVYYEALHKPRKNPTACGLELQRRFRVEMRRGLFVRCRLDIADLQDIEVLQQRMKLGKGELSALAFAKKAGLGLLTDDQKARRLAGTVVMPARVQTTPQLFGWLFFSGRLVDADMDGIIREHLEFGRPLAEYFRETYEEACRCRLADTYRPNKSEASPT